MRYEDIKVGMRVQITGGGWKGLTVVGVVERLDPRKWYGVVVRRDDGNVEPCHHDELTPVEREFKVGDVVRVAEDATYTLDGETFPTRGRGECYMLVECDEDGDWELSNGDSVSPQFLTLLTLVTPTEERRVGDRDPATGQTGHEMAAKKEREFRPGDRVRCVRKAKDNDRVVGKVGTVTGVKATRPLVKWDGLTVVGSSWSVSRDAIELVTPANHLSHWLPEQQAHPCPGRHLHIMGDTCEGCGYPGLRAVPQEPTCVCRLVRIDRNVVTAELQARCTECGSVQPTELRPSWKLGDLIRLPGGR